MDAETGNFLVKCGDTDMYSQKMLKHMDIKCLISLLYDNSEKGELEIVDSILSILEIRSMETFLPKEGFLSEVLMLAAGAGKLNIVKYAIDNLLKLAAGAGERMEFLYTIDAVFENELRVAAVSRNISLACGSIHISIGKAIRSGHKDLVKYSCKRLLENVDGRNRDYYQKFVMEQALNSGHNDIEEYFSDKPIINTEKEIGTKSKVKDFISNHLNFLPIEIKNEEVKELKENKENKENTYLLRRRMFRK